MHRAESKVNKVCTQQSKVSKVHIAHSRVSKVCTEQSKVCTVSAK